MLDTGQRVMVVKKRAFQLHRRREQRAAGHLLLFSVAICCCLAAAAGNFSHGGQAAVQGFCGETMLLQGAGGYVLVGILCFVAAVVITIACLHSKEKNKQQDDKTKEDEET